MAMSDSSGGSGDASVKGKTAQYNAAKLNQPRQNLAGPMHRDTAREKNL